MECKHPGRGAQGSVLAGVVRWPLNVNPLYNQGF